MNTLLQLRTDEKKAAYRRIESWKKNHDELELLWEVEDMVEGALADRDKDERLFQYALQRVKGKDKRRIEEVNKFVQQYCDQSIRMHSIIREVIRGVVKTGHAVQIVKDLDKATDDYKRWKEDYPDLLIMAYDPIDKLVQKQVKQILNGSEKKPKLAKTGRMR